MGIRLKELHADKIESAIDQEVKARAGGYGYSRYNPLFTISYDGEKTPGELGSIKKYIPDFKALRNRSWQAYLESDIAQAILKKFTSWVVGSGLKIQSEPVEMILETAGIRIDKKEYTRKVETRFRLFCESKRSTFNQEKTLHQAAREAYKNAIIGGDVLVIQKVVNGNIEIQCIDGDHVITPFDGGETAAAKIRGNTISHGIEMDAKSRHIAYYVYDINGKFHRVKARGSKGQRMAWIVYGMQYRYDNHRGIPIIASVLEKAGKLDRYTEAAVAGAEERAKIPFFIQHGAESTGENPLAGQIRGSLGLNSKIDGASADSYANGERLASKIAATSQKQAYNMPVGSEMKAISSDMELGFDKFLMSNLQLLSAAVEAPLEVVLSAFNSNYSASRAAIKDWEHTLMGKRKDFAEAFYKPIFELWLIIQDINGSISSPKLFESRMNDLIVFEAYTNCRFIGANVPHIDPVKEVDAIRRKLGPEGAHLPLTTAEKATEALGEGDFENNVINFREEIAQIDKTVSPNGGPIAPEKKEEENDKD